MSTALPGQNLVEGLRVSGQIMPADFQSLKDAGYEIVIDNRPDSEIGPDLASTEMAAAAARVGLRFHYLPFHPGGLSPDLVEAFDAVRQEGKSFAYCRSGGRCATLWALSEAGRQPASAILETAGQAGYDLSHIAPLLAGAAARG